MERWSSSLTIGEYGGVETGEGGGEGWGGGERLGEKGRKLYLNNSKISKVFNINK